ncbi:MAG TPA: hydrogenase iron-sulfur subunit [Candidatus Bathyarchaeia archaeon]|nr:hydrogenase iron-sulfur subunit [Candidatus Bathyarchaeia archaeon]
MGKFEPKIIGFLCNWCSYAGADLAGVSRFQYPPNLRVVRVMCSGRIDPTIPLEVFMRGADGIMILGCHPADCHYVEGNLHEERKVKMLKKLLSLTGLESERLRLDWVSAAEGQRFAQIITEFTEDIKKLGPSPLSGEKPNQKILGNLEVAKNAASDFRLRVLVGRERELTEKGNVYEEKIPQEDFDSLLNEVVEDEFIRQKIHLLTRVEPLSIKDLAEAVEIKPSAVLQQIVNMRRRNMITVDCIKGTTPLYRALEVA